jgi:DNA uptake protein ComE-like DNA-binding protein
MNWRDLLYFSKGERRLLILLLALITAGSVFLVANDIPIDKTGKPANPLPVSGKAPEKKQSPRKRPKPQPAYAEKFPAGTLVELNAADTATLKKVPGIGSVFAGRIVKYRSLLGGFYSVAQLREVYGMEERYHSLQNWFYADSSLVAKLPVNRLSSNALARHPYLNDKQARALGQLRNRKGRIGGWENLRLLEEFTEADRERLAAYLSFQ